jgi:hypothetical protein
MRKNSRGVFPRLAIVGSRNRNAQTTSPGCQAQIAQMTPADRSFIEQPAAPANGLTVMPKRLLHGPLPMLWAFCKMVRNLMVSEQSQRRHAAVLAFRGHALLAPLGVAAPTGDNSLEKKASESVRWESDRSTVSQEEGRG